MSNRENILPENRSLTEALATVAESVRRSTVQVQGNRNEAGSGVIWSDDGVIITNAHVIRGNQATVKLADGRVLSAHVTHRNAQRDLVALKVDATDLAAADLGNSDRLRVGEFVLAVGHPFGLARAVTTGIIHSLGTSKTRSRHWIQADIALAPGNSGGPLANAQGEVIGINTMIVDGRGFAIASNAVQRFLQQSNDRPYLGVTLQPMQLVWTGRRTPGWLITAIELNSPAAMAQLQIGDILIGVRGHLFQFANELMQILNHCYAGDGMQLNVLREGRPIVADVVLCNKDLDANAA